MTSFFRLDYPSEAALAEWIAEGTIPAAPHELALKVRHGDFVLAARFNVGTRLGEVRAVGRVNSPGERKVHWATADFDLRPSSQGQQFWRREHFRFADPVAARYLLEAACTECFTDEPISSQVPRAASKAAGDRASLALGPRLSHRTAQDQEGYVYVIRSDYGYKIGKTKHLRDRTRLFGVKLPFPIALEMSGWFADYSRAERKFHSVYHDKRLEGEWFDLNADDLAALRRELVGPS